ncbi:helicase [Pseudomonas taiwanensis]|nr:helicase [Pseudomonas taiwanensis]
MVNGTFVAADCFPAWPAAEVAAVTLIQKLPMLATKGSVAVHGERLLSDLITSAAEMDSLGGKGTFGAAMVPRFQVAAFASALEQLPSWGLRLLDPDSVAQRKFLLADGKWDFDFSSRHSAAINPYTEQFSTPAGKTFLLTDQQARSFRFFANELHENLHLQALAGTGKTHLIERMVDLLAEHRPLILALTKHQRNAVMKRVGKKDDQVKTFGEFALEVLLHDSTCPNRLKWGTTTKAKVDEDLLVQDLSILPVAGMSARQVASVAFGTVSRYCHSPDLHISTRHLPRTGEKLSDVDQHVLVEYANRLWDEVREPRSTRQKLPVFIYHRLKQLSLSEEACVPPGFTHIIIDEAHEIPAPLEQFLRRCDIPVITLGDACQRLDGIVPSRGENIRKREVFQSVRAGRQVESAINALLSQNPLVHVHPLEGNRQRDTRTVFYDRLDVPPEPSTILVGSEWGIFEWAQRLSAKNAPFALLPGAQESFRGFVSDCIRLYHEGLRPRYGALFRYRTWDDLRKAMGNDDPSFTRIDRMLAKGYSTTDFDQLLLTQVAPDSARYLLGMVSHAKNMEVDSVMLAPDLLGRVRQGDRVGAARLFAALYTGGTRARYRLYVPGQLRDWAIDQAARAAQAGHGGGLSTVP